MMAIPGSSFHYHDRISLPHQTEGKKGFMHHELNYDKLETLIQQMP